jgi:methionyl-tRNA formyltransferase
MSKHTYAFFGTPYVARDTLAYLVEHGYTPAVVITSPDAPRGRGLTLTPCETKQWALEHNIPVLSPEKLDESAREKILSYGCEYALVVAYGKILPRKMLEAFPKGALNVHYSLLPKYRGASPVEGALLNDEKVTGVTIQKMVFELDAGDVLASREVSILPTDTTRELRPRLIAEGAELLVSVLPAFAEGEIIPIPQDPSAVTHVGKIEKTEGELTLGVDDAQNWHKYRAFAESPGTYFFVERDGKKVRVKIKTAQFENGVFTPLRVVPEGKKETDFSAL